MAAWPQGGQAHYNSGHEQVLALTGNPVAQVLSVAWDKLNEITGASLPISNASQANIDVRNAVQAQGGKVVEVDHSRGSLTSSIATTEQVNQGETNAAIGTVTFNGAAANAQRMADQVNTVTSGTGTVQQATHKDDAIGTAIGGNFQTGGQDASMLDAHTTYGPNIPIEDKIRVWGSESGSSSVVISPSNIGGDKK
jgi:filamentous hemagglutinin